MSLWLEKCDEEVMGSLVMHRILFPLQDTRRSVAVIAMEEMVDVVTVVLAKSGMLVLAKHFRARSSKACATTHNHFSRPPLFRMNFKTNIERHISIRQIQGILCASKLHEASRSSW